MFLFPKISGSKSLEALSEIDELPPPVPKKGSKPDLTSGISPESIRRRTTIGGRLLHRSSSPASMLRTVTSPMQPPHDKYYSLDLFTRDFYVESVDVQSEPANQISHSWPLSKRWCALSRNGSWLRDDGNNASEANHKDDCVHVFRAHDHSKYIVMLYLSKKL